MSRAVNLQMAARDLHRGQTPGGSRFAQSATGPILAIPRRF